jgi:hypothetical protein
LLPANGCRLLKSTEHDRLPADRDLLVAAGQCHRKDLRRYRQGFLSRRLAPVPFDVNAGSSQQAAISRPLVVFS